MKNNMMINFTPHMYIKYIQPQGYLNEDHACHALFYYATVATAVWDRIEHTLVMEESKDPSPNYHQLFISIAKLYGIDPNQMENYWELIDKQFDKLGISKAPNCVRFGSRSKVIIIPHQERLH